MDRGTWYLYGRAVDKAGNETIDYLGVYFIGIDPTQPYTATLNVYKDGVLWDTHSKTFTLELSTDSDETEDISSGTAEVVTGVWKVLDDGEYTGTDIVIYGDVGSATLNYYTVNFDTRLDGDATDAEIISDTGVLTGEAVLSGTTITLTASGEGADFYEYEWNDSLYTLGDTLTITVTNTVNLECVVIGYLPGTPPLTYTTTVSLNLDDCPLSSRRDVTINGNIPMVHDGNGNYSGNVVTGTHCVYVNGEDTGLTIMVRNSGANTTVVDFYSLILEAGAWIESVSDSGEHIEGTVITISAIAQDGCYFNEWVLTPVYSASTLSSSTLSSGSVFTTDSGNITSSVSITMPGYAVKLTAVGISNPLDVQEPIQDLDEKAQPDTPEEQGSSGEEVLSISDTTDTTNDPSGRGRVPQTGDDANTRLWLMLLLTSITGIFGLLYWRKSRIKKGTW